MSDVSKPTRAELVQALRDLNGVYDNLPQIAMHMPVNHSDMSSLLAILCGIYAIDVESK